MNQALIDCNDALIERHLSLLGGIAADRTVRLAVLIGIGDAYGLSGAFCQLHTPGSSHPQEEGVEGLSTHTSSQSAAYRLYGQLATGEIGHDFLAYDPAAQPHVFQFGIKIGERSSASRSSGGE